MATVATLEGSDSALVEADMAARTAERFRRFARNAEGRVGFGLPGIAVSPEFVDLMVPPCLE